MLLQNGGEVGLGDIVFKGAVAEHAGRVTGGRQFLVPVDNALGQRLHLLAGNLLGKTGHQDAATHGMHLTARDGALLDGYAQVEAELEQQFVEHIGLAAAFEQVILMIEQRSFQVVWLRIPRTDIGVVKLEDAEAGIAGKQRVVGFDLGGGAAQALFGEFGD